MDFGYLFLVISIIAFAIPIVWLLNTFTKDTKK